MGLVKILFSNIRVKNQKLLIENKPLKKWIKDQAAQRAAKNQVVQPAPMDIDAGDEKFTGFIPEECFFDDYDDDTFRDIMEEQKKMINLLKSKGISKHLANRILIIFDDLVGSSLFAGSRGSYFKGVNTRHRHYSASFIMVSQGYKEVPKTIRTNWTGLIVFEIGNEREVFVIYEEYAMGLNQEQWLESYREATKAEHSFLYINFQQPRSMRMWENFDKVLYHST